jgi:hypothetical protein
MGKEFRTLDAEREALPSWEQQVVTETLPLLKDTAANTDSAIQYLNDNRPYLWGETYRGYAERIWQDSEQMVKTLRTHLQLAKLHDKEQHLDNSLGIAGGQ